MNPDYQKFLDAFNEHALRPILTAGKEKLDEALSSLSSSQLTRAVEDAYHLLNGANGIDGIIGKIDTSKIADAVDQMKAKMEDQQTSLQIAQVLKQVAGQTSAETLESLVFKAVEKAPLEQQFAAQMLLAQIGPMLEEMKTASVEDIAAQIRTVAGSLSGYDVAQQVTQLLQAGVQQLGQTGDIPAQLPSPQEVADTMQGLGKAISDTLGKAANSPTFAETISALKEFNQKVLELGSKQTPKAAPSTEKPAPKKPKKGGPKNGGWKI
ncbi:MAG: hypothetical protein KGL10_00225 [Alphaproteobacteria bacterium]|nr:hypothetical protein [Alphaproteobacteria bacterium]MDE2335717.1 hypothetical protein [Alphaproteobacteria bacterium]